MRPNGLSYPEENYLYTPEPSRFLNASMDNRELDIHDGTISDIRTGGFHHCVICAAGEGLRVYNILIQRIHEPETLDEDIASRMYAGYGTTHRLATINLKGPPRGVINDHDIHSIRMNDVLARQGKIAVAISLKTKETWLNRIVQANPDHRLFQFKDSEGITVTQA